MLGLQEPLLLQLHFNRVYRVWGLGFLDISLNYVEEILMVLNVGLGFRVWGFGFRA